MCMKFIHRKPPKLKRETFFFLCVSISELANGVSLRSFFSLFIWYFYWWYYVRRCARECVRRSPYIILNRLYQLNERKTSDRKALWSDSLCLSCHLLKSIYIQMIFVGRLDTFEIIDFAAEISRIRLFFSAEFCFYFFLCLCLFSILFLFSVCFVLLLFCWRFCCCLLCLLYCFLVLILNVVVDSPSIACYVRLCVVAFALFTLSICDVVVVLCLFHTRFQL